MFDKNLFKSMIVRCGKTAKEIASEIGINEATLYRKMRGESDFTRNEISEIRSTLDLSDAELNAIFFA